VDLPRLVHWAAQRQGWAEGGFNGRTNKLVDGCYSFWVGGLFALLQAVAPGALDPAAGAATILAAAAEAAAEAAAAGGPPPPPLVVPPFPTLSPAVGPVAEAEQEMHRRHARAQAVVQAALQAGGELDDAHRTQSAARLSGTSARTRELLDEAGEAHKARAARGNEFRRARGGSAGLVAPSARCSAAPLTASARLAAIPPRTHARATQAAEHASMHHSVAFTAAAALFPASDAALSYTDGMFGTTLVVPPVSRPPGWTPPPCLFNARALQLWVLRRAVAAAAAASPRALSTRRWEERGLGARCVCRGREELRLGGGESENPQ